MKKHTNLSDPRVTASEFVAEIRALPAKHTPNDERAIRRRYSRELKRVSPEFVIELARELFGKYGRRWLAYEFITNHRAASQSIGEAELEEFGQGMDSWGAVDCFGRVLAGPTWLNRQVPDELIHKWAYSEDRWWRRAALVSTVALNVKVSGGTGDTERTLEVCRILVDDHDDMVVKALSWALRVLAPHDPKAVREFLSAYDKRLAARVKREVRNKLATGLKNPRRKRNSIEYIPFTCTSDCGGRCELVAYVQDGRLVRIDTPPNRSDTAEMPRLVPCLRGRSQGRLLNTRERLLKPLRRVGTRGSDQFEEVTWDDALHEVAQRLIQIRDQHCPEAILHLTGYGSIGGRGISGGYASDRFFSYFGSVTGIYGNPSSWCAGVANQWMLGGVSDSIHSSTLPESRLIILWGMNPAENRHGINLAYFIAQARDSGAQVILIDPRHTDSGILADQWIPIRPGTDVALVAAIAYVWESEGLVDAEFMTSHTVGYDDYCRYVLGEDDELPKKPEWGEEITEVPANTIRQLAYKYASTKPALILAGLGPQRSRYGEQTERALITLACMSGNVGVPGGGFAHSGRHSSAGIRLGSLPRGSFRPTRQVKAENWAKYILDGSLQPPVRMAYIVATNAINRSSSTLANARALEQLEYVVAQDQFFTPTARYADVVFPICVELERSDLVAGQSIHYNRQALPPAGESRTDYWVFSRLAELLGFGEQYTGGKTESEWIEHFLQAGKMDTAALRRDGIIRSINQPSVDLARFRADPAANPLRTPSGLIQITCPQAEDYGLPIIPSYIYSRPEESRDYPLQLVTPHSKLRANSTGHANPWLQRLEPHAVWINPRDAEARGIAQGDVVEVSNQFGTVIIPAKVTERIMPGVVCIYQGTWYQPAKDGMDEGGCANVLTGHHLSPTGGMMVHSEWVQISKSARCFEAFRRE